MSELSVRLELLKTNLAAMYPDRIVTRDLKDFSLRKKPDLEIGIYTIISKGLSDFNSPAQLVLLEGTHGILLVGQIELPESADPSEVEDAENEMWDEVKAFIQTPGAGLCPLDPVSMLQSQQIDHPFGWIAVELSFRYFD